MGRHRLAEPRLSLREVAHEIVRVLTLSFTIFTAVGVLVTVFAGARWPGTVFADEFLPGLTVYAAILLTFGVLAGGLRREALS